MKTHKQTDTLRQRGRCLRLKQLVLFISIGCTLPEAKAQIYTFDPVMLGKSAKDIDMTLINKGGQLPGIYTVDIILNGDRVDSRDVAFSQKNSLPSETVLEPCLSVEQLSLYGIKVDKYPGLSSGGKCVNLSAIPDAKADFQFYSQQLLLSIPQVALNPKLSGIAPQQLWDDGISALLMGYSANTNQTEYWDEYQNNNSSSYVQINPGANLGAWRLRNQTNWSTQGNEGEQWQTVYTYAERGLYNMKSRVTLGDRSTPDDVFSSVPFRGVMLGTDDNMMPYNQREYAPVIRGIARTQARVEVKQNGYTVYSQTVAPGPFALSDLNVSGGGSSGDLQVTVWETDGNPQMFTVPYQTPAISLHEGYLKYNVMAGRYRPAGAGTRDSVGQATVMYGLPWGLTVYGGSQIAEHYQSASLGLGMSMDAWGAISVDGTGSRAQRQHVDVENGGAWRVRYSKEVVATETTLTMTSYQYASSGFNSLSDVMDSRNNNDDNNWQNGNNSSDRSKSTSSLALDQSIGGGTLSLNGTRTNYWHHPGHDDTFGASYGIGIYGISMTLSLSQNTQYKDAGDVRRNTMANLYFSVPLERWLSTGGTSMNATYQMTSSKDSDITQVGLDGWSFNRQLNWDVQQSHQAGSGVSAHDNSTARMTWYGRYGQIGGNYSYSPHQRQIGGAVAGGIIVHRNGITLGQPLGDTMALIEAPGATGVPVTGLPGVSTDFRGYTTKAYLTPYQENTVSLDPTRLPPNAEVTQTDVRVIPTAGAIVSAKFSTRIGERALMTLTRARGEQTVPFGTVVTQQSGGGAGIVGDNGQVYLTGLLPTGTLVAKWGEKSQCTVHYTLSNDGKEKISAGIYIISNVCQ